MKNLKMFKQVVGDDHMSHCCLVTTKWSRQPQDLSNSREDELRSNSKFWKPLLDKGAQMKQFKDTTRSALEIIYPFTKCPRFFMKITEEYNIQGKKLHQTEAGKEVNEDLEQARKDHFEEIEALKEDRREALEAKDQKMVQMIETEKARLQKEMDEMKAGQELLHKKFADEKQEMEEKWAQDRRTRLKRREEIKTHFQHGAVRVGAIGLAASAIVLTGGIATPAAALFYAAVEDAIQN